MRDYLPSMTRALFSVFAIDVDQTRDQYDDCTFLTLVLMLNENSYIAIKHRAERLEIEHT